MQIVPLSKVRQEDVLLCGHKGAQLGELASLGLPVPDGFVVTTEAFSDFMKQTGLGEQIEGVLSQVDPALHPDLSTVSEEIKGWALQVHLDEALQAEVQESYQNLKSKFTAVRSSPVVADDTGVLFSGRLATTMHVTGANLAENIERCWMSLYASRGLEYLFKENLIGRSVLVAVVVQALVEAEVSGVMYCGKLMTQSDSCLVVESGWGLGETLVSGIVTPDRYVVNFEKSEIAETTTGKQLKEYISQDDRLKFVDVPDSRVNARKLNDKQVLSLAALYKKAYEHYQKPQKIEWAMANGQIYLLQTRDLDAKVE